jgi:hypothetical protein
MLSISVSPDLPHPRYPFFLSLFPAIRSGELHRNEQEGEVEIVLKLITKCLVRWEKIPPNVRVLRKYDDAHFGYRW